MAMRMCVNHQHAITFICGNIITCHYVMWAVCCLHIDMCCCSIFQLASAKEVWLEMDLIDPLLTSCLWSEVCCGCGCGGGVLWAWLERGVLWASLESEVCCGQDCGVRCVVCWASFGS